MAPRFSDGILGFQRLPFGAVNESNSLDFVQLKGAVWVNPLTRSTATVPNFYSVFDPCTDAENGVRFTHSKTINGIDDCCNTFQGAQLSISGTLFHTMTRNQVYEALVNMASEIFYSMDNQSSPGGVPYFNFGSLPECTSNVFVPPEDM